MPSTNNKKKGGKKGTASSMSSNTMARLPWLVRKEHSDALGNHFIAKENIATGSVIGVDTPVLQLTLNPRKCSQCLARLAVVVCCPHHKGGQCGEKYCSAECQELAWESYHKVQDAKNLGELVEAAKKGVSNTRHNLLLVIKLLSMYQLPEKNQVLISLIDSLLVNHTISEMVSPKEGSQISSSIAESMPHRIAAALSVIIPDVVRCQGSILAGNFAIPFPDFLQENTDHLARTCYPTNRLKAPTGDVGWIKKVTSLLICYVFGDLNDSTLMGDTNYFNHSCVPNAYVNLDEDMKYIVAKKDIMKGEQVFICYYNSETPGASRRRMLEFHHGFVCCCEKCVAEEESPTCDFCHKTPGQRLRFCTRCNSCRYCGRECQVKHWPKHKKSCNELYKMSQRSKKRTAQEATEQEGV